MSTGAPKKRLPRPRRAARTSADAVAPAEQTEPGPEPETWRVRTIDQTAYCKGCRQPFAMFSEARVFPLPDVGWVRYHAECWPWR